MEEEPILREALARRDAALAEARRLDEFVRLYNELRGRIGGGKYGEVVGLQSSPPLVVVGDKGMSDGEFMLDKSRPNVR